MVWEPLTRIRGIAEHIPSAEVADRIVTQWDQELRDDLGQDMWQLPSIQMWKFMESMERLLAVIIDGVCGERPRLSTFSMMNSLDEPSDCELYIIWASPLSNFYGGAVEGCRVYRISDAFWPGRSAFVGEDSMINLRARELVQRWWALLIVHHDAGAF